MSAIPLTEENQCFGVVITELAMILDSAKGKLNMVRFNRQKQKRKWHTEEDSSQTKKLNHLDRIKFRRRGKSLTF